MNMKAVIPLVAGLCVGGFALKIGLDTLKKAKGAPAATVPVWAAKVDVPRGTKVTEEMLTSIDFPVKLVPPGALKDKEAVVGRVPRVDAPAGLPILDQMLLAPGELSGVHVPPGYRAVAVKIDESSGVDFHLEPGCRVDVVGFLTARRGNQQQKLARTIIENVGVAAVGPRLSAVDKDSGKKASRPTRAVTLLVKPDQVPILHLAEQQGKLKLSMRNSDDGQTLGNAGFITFEELLNPSAAGQEDSEIEPELTDQEFATSGGLLSWLGLSTGSKPPTDPPPTSEPAAAPEEPAEPEWVVRVWRGNQLEVVRYKNRDSRERVEDQAGQKQSSSAKPAAASARSRTAPPKDTPTVANAAPRTPASDERGKE